MREPRWREVARIARQRGIRARSVASAVLVVLVALLAGGAGLVYLLQANLDSNARDAAQTRAEEVASMVQAQGVSSTTNDIQQESRSGQLVQVLSSDGQVLGASSRVVDTTPMSVARPAPGETTTDEVDLDHVGHGGDWMVVSTGVEAGGTDYVVQVAIPIEVQHETVQTVTFFLLAATPLLVIGVGLAVWILVGRALRAVEDIRAEVATIDDQGLSRRVAVPADTRRDRGARRDDEHDAGSAGDLPPRAAVLRLRRQSRAPQPAGHVDDGCRARRRGRRGDPHPPVGDDRQRTGQGTHAGRQPDDAGPGRCARSSHRA